jgi:RIO kinase 1
MIGNRAYNDFLKSMKHHTSSSVTKGVASHGTGRAGKDSSATKGKAMDPQVRILLTKAVNKQLIERCNGAVKQGKEAVVYHADKGRGPACEGFDVAIKVFKRLTDFRGRGDYVDGDPRYLGRTFRNYSSREQLDVWCEKEYRNLVRAHRANVPVPTPLEYTQNVLFMRFMGNDGWPAPQIREIDMRKGSRKWSILYDQVMESVRRLYIHARLVHGDLSEYNILIAPVFQVDHPIGLSGEDDDVVVNGRTSHDHDLQTVLIDFGQAVDTRHPEAHELLKRDLTRVKDFFDKQGIETKSLEEALQFVIEDSDDANATPIEPLDQANNTTLEPETSVKLDQLNNATDRPKEKSETHKDRSKTMENAELDQISV